MPASLRPALLIGPLLLFLGAVYLIPFLGVVRWSVTLPAPSVDQYRAIASDPLVHSVLGRTVRICLMVTVLSVAAAYLLALVWVRGSPWQRFLAELCILIPFWISVLTRAFGWIALLSNRGVINTFLQDLGLIDLPIALVRNEFGVIVGMVHFLIPFAVFPIASALQAMDERVILAARGMGASRGRIFWTLILPMSAKGVVGAGLLVFVFALGFFITPALLGGGRSVMVAELIYLRVFQSPNWGFAAALTVVLMLTVSIMLVMLLRQLGESRAR
jgi:putative spermidine/putrescine transport system permease protein